MRSDSVRLLFLRKTWPLLVAPFLLLFCHALFSHARGAFYLALNYDPDYAYLFNGLNLVNGVAPAHVDHPGITVQLFAAGLIKLANLGSSAHGTNVAVISHSESYLEGLNFALMMCCFVSVLLVGWVVWRKTGSLTGALLLQATPFLAGEDFVETVRFRPELFILVIVLILAGVLYVHARRDEREGPGAIFLLGFLAATGAATKLNFLPLTLLPLFGLRTWRDRAAYAMVMGLFATVWVLPLSPHHQRLADWVMALLTRQGRYGAGAPGLLNQQYPTFLVQLVGARPLFFLMMGLSIAAVAFYWLGRRNQRTPEETRLTRLLTGLFLVGALEYLMVAKYGHPRYLFPALTLGGFNAALLWALVRRWRGDKAESRRTALVGVALAILAAGWSSLRLRHLYDQMAKSRDRHGEMAKRLETGFTNQTLVYYFGCSSPYHALWFGNAYSGRRYGRIIGDDVFPKHAPAYFVEERAWPNGTFWYSVSGPDEELQNRLKRGEVVFLAGQEWPRNEEKLHFVILQNAPAVTIDPVHRCGDEAIYRIRALSGGSGDPVAGSPPGH